MEPIVKLEQVWYEYSAYEDEEEVTSAALNGIDLSLDEGKFIAIIGYNYKKQYLGTYETLLDAAIAYNEKALELYGEFANLNDLENIKNAYSCNGR